MSGLDILRMVGSMRIAVTEGVGKREAKRSLGFWPKQLNDRKQIILFLFMPPSHVVLNIQQVVKKFLLQSGLQL